VFTAGRKKRGRDDPKQEIGRFSNFREKSGMEIVGLKSAGLARRMWSGRSKRREFRGKTREEIEKKKTREMSKIVDAAPSGLAERKKC